ncbi:hypothetical protein ACIBCN_14930 [Nocardia sp. NPDC051052]|uniref:hypothetical protein n=1 Tax=Nocardia sp. NPDC051052 TaxID=3364322 RepID=UPI0037A18B42
MLAQRRKQFADLDPSKLSPARLVLAEAVRVLIRQTGCSSLRAIERDLAEMLDELRKEAGADKYKLRFEYGYLTKSVLWDWAYGNRKGAPKEAQLWELHSLASASAGSAEEVISWDELDELRRRVESEPAETGRVVSPGVAPVPRPEEDRRNSATVGVQWDAADDLAAYAAVGNREGAIGVIRHVGATAAPVETANAVIACRDMGLIEETEAIISYAGNRSERDVLYILRYLQQHNRRVDADALLDRALARTS